MPCALVKMVVDWPFTVAVAVLTVEVAAGVVATGAGVVAVGVGVLPPEPVELPQAATSIASNRTMLMGKARLRFFIPYVFLLIGQVKLGFRQLASVEQYAEGYRQFAVVVRYACRAKQVITRVTVRYSRVSVASSFCGFPSTVCLRLE